MKSKSKYFNRKIFNIAWPLLVTWIIVMGLHQIWFISQFLEWWFSQITTSGQIKAILITAIGSVYFAVVCLNQEERIEKLELDKDTLREQLLCNDRKIPK